LYTLNKNQSTYKKKSINIFLKFFVVKPIPKIMNFSKIKLNLQVCATHPTQITTSIYIQLMDVNENHS
jgi:hypothetical protein